MSARRQLVLAAAVVTVTTAVFAWIAIGTAGSGRDERPHTLTNRELANLLGNQDSGFVTMTVRCAAAAGTYAPYGAYDHRCRRTRYDGIFCLPGTGVTPETVYVRVRGRHYRIVGTDPGRHVFCESTA